ncbi:MAG TPA: condensation domain-containing protein [Blastocatellia bacterium]
MTLESLGPIDRQVDIDGRRIELGEIEAVLNSHPAVGLSLVLMREKNSEKRLTAYVCCRADATTAPDLRAHLESKIPAYMVPSFFVLLDAFPVNSDGKVLIDGLPAPFEIAGPDTAHVPPGTDLQLLLAGLWREVLGVGRVGIHDDYFDLGGDSIQSIRIAVRANDAGVKFNPRQIIQLRTIARLASVIEAETPSTRSELSDAEAGEGPLTPTQHWFFENSFEAMHHWNQARTLRVSAATDPLALDSALVQLALHHGALRHRFIRDELGWRRASAAPTPGGILARVDMSGISKNKWQPELDDLLTVVQATLDIETGDLMRAVLIDCGACGPSSLVLMIHHLSVDGFSWGIILDDLETLYRDIRSGLEPNLPKTTSFNNWAARLNEYAQSPEVRAEFPYWLSGSRKRTSTLPVDYNEGINSEGSSDKVLAALSREETKALLQEVPRRYHTTVVEAMLTALAMAACRWIGSRTLLVDLENHGRADLFQGVDLSRTVGWFTTVCPLLLDTGPFSEIADVLIAVKEQARSIPKEGIGFGLLRYLCKDASVSGKLSALPRAQIRFNYLSQPAKVSGDDSILQRYYGSSGRAQDPGAVRSHLIDVTGAITNGQLYTGWVYSGNRHRTSTVEKLANAFIDCLREIIVRSQALDERRDASAFLPPDLNRRDLNRLLNLFGEDE